MKKTNKFIVIFLCLFLLTSCKVYVYNVGEEENNSSTTTNTSTTPSADTSGTTIKKKNINYSVQDGLVNYTSTIPSENASWDEVYKNVITSVVTIRNVVDGEIKSTGSGVFFASDNSVNGYSYIYTNAHVVEEPEDSNPNSVFTTEVLLSNGTLIEGELIGYDKNEDVAVIQISKRSGYTIATLRQSNTLKIGEEILTIGSPLGLEYSETATSGIISNLNIAITPQNSSLPLYLIQIDASLNPGNSGGPLFDKGGNLIGINSMKLLSSGTTTNIESFNYAIPISHFSLVANYLLQGSLYYRPFLSITFSDVRVFTASEREKKNITINNGLLLVSVDTISPLYNKASAGQVITHIEGVEVLKSSDFSVELLKHAPNDTIDVTICNSDGTNSHNLSIKLLKR